MRVIDERSCKHALDMSVLDERSCKNALDFGPTADDKVRFPV